MKKGRRWIVLVFMVLGLVDLDSFVIAGNTEQESKSLHGLKGVYVLIEDLDTEIKQDGLTDSQLRTDTELRLRMAGIRVLSLEEAYVTPGRPWLLVNVNILKLRYIPTYVYNISVEFYQNVSLLRASNIRIPACTWDSSILGMNPKLEAIRSTTKKLVDRFINAYLSVNPK